jgi:Fic family protein
MRYRKANSKAWIEYNNYKMKINRIIIYPKDIQRITGKSDRYGRLLLNKIRQKFLKEPHQFVTIEEFCQFTGLSLEQVSTYLDD